MVSAVGDDELGHNALSALQGHGVNTGCVQIAKQETGKVLVELDSAGVASYRFAEDTAWDNLEWNDALAERASECDAVCFGTLGQRSDSSRAVVRKFVNATSNDTLRILDVNLRAPFFDDKVILESLELASVLKLNDDELPHLAELIGLKGTDPELLRQVADRYELRCVALTRGPNGAILSCGDAISDLPGVPVQVADTVGAGDAFTAAMTLGLLSGQSVEQINRKSIAVAAYVCSQNGATPSFPASIAGN
jgi:fructokinase